MKRKTHTEPIRNKSSDRTTYPTQSNRRKILTEKATHTLSLFSRKTRALNKYIYYKRSVFVGDSHVLYAIVKRTTNRPTDPLKKPRSQITKC